MAPPAKRRKRAIVDDDSDDNQDGHQQPQTTLTRFLSSPSKPPASPTRDKNGTAATSPSPLALRKRTTRASTAAAAAAAAATATAGTTATTTIASPSTKHRPAASVPRSPSASPVKSRATRARKRKAGDAEKEKKEAHNKAAKGPRSADLPTLFSKQAQAQSQRTRPRRGGPASAASQGSATGGKRADEISSDPISVSENNDDGEGADDDDDDDVDYDDVPLALSSSSAAAGAAGSSLVERARAAQRRFAGAGVRNGDGNGNGVAQQPSGTQAAGKGVGGGGQKFLRLPPRPRAGETKSTAVAGHGDDDARPWSERFAPVSLDELAVHKRKVLDVRRWLDEVLAGRMRQRLLVLKGPAGSGKTTTVRLLAKDMRCEVLEWRNPASSFGVPGPGYQSAAAQFEEFLGRGGKFGQLDVESDEGTPPPPPPPPSSGNGPNTGSDRRLILIEEFPNTFMRSSTGLVAFRNAILQFLAANVPALASFGSGYPSEPVTPIVMVISETLLTTTSASADSFTAHRLLGPEILRHPGTGVIEFNPIAPTFLTKALELVVQKEARKSGRRRTPGPLVLQRLGEIGDIRSAISSLEFLCVKGDDEADWGSKVTFTKPKRGSKDVPALTKGEKESLELVSQREATLGIFHAVGKVVYNKRNDFPAGSTEAAAEMLPDYMAHHARPKRSEVSVDHLIDEIGTDTHTFISALHENYALSCEQTGPLDPNSSMDYINGCLDYLSASDLLNPSWDIFFGGRGFGGWYAGKDSGSHVLRQDEMAFQVAVRGLLFSLPSPVKRQTHPTGRGGDTYKMFYPTYLKLWRTKEELEGLVDMWATKMLKGEEGGLGPSQLQDGSSASAHHGPSAFRKASGSAFPGGQASSSASQQDKAGAHKISGSSTPLLSLGNAARQELLLERLPYMAHIARQRRCSFGTMRIRDLDRIVSFQGIGTLGAGEDEGEDGADEEASDGPAMAEPWATDRPTEEGTPRKRRGLGALLRAGRQGKGNGAGEGEDLASLPMQSLVISDDDIEDD